MQENEMGRSPIVITMDDDEFDAMRLFEKTEAAASKEGERLYKRLRKSIRDPEFFLAVIEFAVLGLANEKGADTQNIARSLVELAGEIRDEARLPYLP